MTDISNQLKRRPAKGLNSFYPKIICKVLTCLDWIPTGTCTSGVSTNPTTENGLNKYFSILCNRKSKPEYGLMHDFITFKIV